MAFRFVHTADIHLDSPLRSLAMRNPDLAELVGDATRQVLVSIVDLCLTESVDALVIAGDLFDGDQTSMKTARFLGSQMHRLHQAGIRVLKIRGNHDNLSRISKQLAFPDNVTVFGGRSHTVLHSAGGIDVAFHGLSFAAAKAPESFLGRYPAPLNEAFNVGIMHTSLAGATGHDVYAPCSVTDLHAHGFRYWALGHIHVRSIHSGASTVVMPGIPQGRDIGEHGVKSVSIVTVRDDGSVDVEERPTAIVQFERVSVDVTGASDWIEVVRRVRASLERVRASVDAMHAVVRVSISGTTPLSWTLLRDRDLMLAEAEQIGEQTGRLWIDKVELDVRYDEDQRSRDVDPVLELAATMRTTAAELHGLRAEAKDLVTRLIADLPPDARGFAGKDEAALDAFLDAILADGAELVAARLKSGAVE